MRKESFLKEIESNINKYGYHITMVSKGLNPRFAYTIGLVDKFGFEITFAGGLFYTNEEVSIIINNVIDKLQEKVNWQELKLEIESLGVFSLSNVDNSWSKLLMLGAYDFYDKDKIQAIQILPDNNHHTLDVPKLSNKFNTSTEPIWQWLVNEWNYKVPKDITVITNLKALKGELITEIMRWEEDEWEMFSGAGPDVEKEDIRIVPIGVLLGIDNSIDKSLGLGINKGLWRDEIDKKWNKWDNSTA
ncbi:DUF4262 domain-containing protein [Aquimarina sp. AD10]|uniref:DUF4262 domain-containing protein n=1 Tax=Aquimarina sp. AD10 TaxID=1714849 RepID=UPI000E47C2DD|nr:DUF4262 domain-containing protein [Aquimarina sp. AD10]AXT61699.1 DUF4262 domain-containing protein [Aquimarina sp. AD10]RKN00952.1 DUF4262 domain-containing protein [Aquimarina sp. AD10]